MVSALEPLLGPCLDEIASAVHCIASAAREETRDACLSR